MVAAMAPKPAMMSVQAEAFPPEFRALNRWVCWSWESNGKKWDKPLRDVWGNFAKVNDPSTWNTFDAVLTAYEDGKCDGIGFILGDLGDGTFAVGLDLDDCITEGEVDADADYLVEKVNTYAEVSPSGNGIKTIALSTKPPPSHGDTGIGVELYSTGRYFTMTGHVYGGHHLLAERTHELLDLEATVWPKPWKLTANGDERARILSALDGLKAARADSYGSWIRVGMTLHAAGDEYLGDWIAWSQKSDKFEDGVCERMWRGFKRPGRLTIGSLFHWAKEDGWKSPAPILSNGAAHTNGKPVPPEVSTFTADALMAMNIPEPRWAIPGLLPQGLNILAGKPKLGKSWLALGFALDIARGGRVLNMIDVEPGEVLYLALEDTKRRLQDRMRKMLDGKPAPPGLTLTTQWPRQDKGGWFALTDWLDKHPKTKLVIIDTWAKFRPQKTRGRDAYEEDYEQAGGIKALADGHGVALLPLHHCRKAEATDPVDEVSGTLGLTAAADSILVLKRERGQCDAVIAVTGRDIEEREVALHWDGHTGLWSGLGEAAEYRMSRERSEILEILRDARRPMKPSEVAPLVRKNTNAVKQLLHKLAKDGWLRNTIHGTYETLNT